MDVIQINEKTAKQFLENIKNKKFMVCFVPFDFIIGEIRKRMIDVAQTKYDRNGNFKVCSRGSGYLDYIDMEYGDPIEIIQEYIHSFIECAEPVSRPSVAESQTSSNSN